VENGYEAVRAVADGSFDAILMDVQMPGMDGLEATRTIRSNEEAGRHVPIIALTAHAMDSDRERCLAAGMDGFLAKPFRADELFAALEQMAPQGAVAAPPAEEPVRRPAVFDREDGLARVEGMIDVLADMASLFLDEQTSLVQTMTDAFAAGDSQTVADTAHRLKGSAGLLGATGTFIAARDLDDLAKAGDMQSAQPAWETLQSELALLEPELRSFIAEARAVAG
jgi:CheY-like chemotaxis protein/HPt (histidine-containing phosphotransfer) domain-containing protein